MANSSDNVRVAIDGAIYVAPTQSTLPASISDAVVDSSPYVDLGYISEDGFTVSRETEVSEIRAWQNSDVVRRNIKIAYSVTATCIETNPEVLSLVWASNSTSVAGGGTKYAPNSLTQNRKTFVFDVLDDGAAVRYVAPVAEVTEVGDIAHANGDDPVGYELTIAIYRVNGVDLIPYYPADD